MQQGLHMQSLASPLFLYEAAEDAIKAGDASLDLKLEAILSLARCGATEFALTRFRELELDTLQNNEAALTLYGRLLKDRAAQLPTPLQRSKLKASAETYDKAFQLNRNVYPGINAATLFCLSGQTEKGLSVAQHVLNIIEQVPEPSSAEDKYFYLATKAEAFLLLDNKTEAVALLHQAITHDPLNYDARASTLLQFERIISHKKAKAGWLDKARPPKTCFFAGKMPDQSDEFWQNEELSKSIGTLLDQQNIGQAFGALAAGADILFAEHILNRKGSLSIILPCPPDVFCATSVAPYGEEWIRRYEKCLSQADHLEIATLDASLDSKLAIELAATIAMGTALKRAKEIATSSVQFLIAPNTDSFTSELEGIWTKSQPQRSVITVQPEKPLRQKAKTTFSKHDDRRQLSAMLFADLTGFGALTDKAVLTSVEHILKPLANIISTHHIKPRHLNSWGDGIFAIFDNVADAASVSIALQKRMQEVDYESIKLPAQLKLRIGVHYGPVTFQEDPVTGAEGVFGSQIAYAARIEPLAPPGSIFASEAFAAALELEADCPVKSTYVGRHALKNAHSDIRLFALTATQ